MVLATLERLVENKWVQRRDQWKIAEIQYAISHPSTVNAALYELRLVRNVGCLPKAFEGKASVASILFTLQYFEIGRHNDSLLDGSAYFGTLEGLFGKFRFLRWVGNVRKMYAGSGGIVEQVMGPGDGSILYPTQLHRVDAISANCIKFGVCISPTVFRHGLLSPYTGRTMDESYCCREDLDTQVIFPLPDRADVSVTVQTHNHHFTEL